MAGEMSEAVTIALITGGFGLAGGGVAGSLVQGWLNRRKTHVEVESIAVAGAERAVQTLAESLRAETARANRAEAAVRERDARIERLEARIEVMQAALDELREELHRIRSM